MTKVVKTAFEKEQREKDEAFLRLSPFQRWEQALKVRMKMRKPGVNYSYRGMKVTVKKSS
jgi:hypothetical protein